MRDLSQARADFSAVSAAVWRISPDCSQDEWWRVAAALFNAFGDDAFDLFDEWSSTAKTPGMYPGRKGCWAKWCFCRNYSQIGVGTIFHFAKGRSA
jgi:hypothetical protein